MSSGLTGHRGANGGPVDVLTTLCGDDANARVEANRELHGDHDGTFGMLGAVDPDEDSLWEARGVIARAGKQHRAMGLMKELACDAPEEERGCAAPLVRSDRDQVDRVVTCERGERGARGAPKRLGLDAVEAREKDGGDVSRGLHLGLTPGGVALGPEASASRAWTIGDGQRRKAPAGCAQPDRLAQRDQARG